MKYTSTFRKILLSIMAVGMFSLSAFADFTPTSPSFPHGGGIVRETGDCNSSDNRCIDGLDFPSFNNFTDSTVGGNFVEGVTDERRFLVASNLGQDGTASNPYTDSVTAVDGDLIYVRGYVHNNGHIDDASAVANNVTLGMNGFTSAGNNYYYSAAGPSVTLSQFTSASNSTPASVADTTTVVSADGTPIKLMYYAQTNAVQSTGGDGYTINPVDFISGGSNIGSVEGCSAESFYTWTIFRVVDGSTPEYDLSIDKTVGTSVADATHKNLTVSAGDVLTYKLTYRNELTSTAIPSGTKIYDDYDETKLDIIWLPNNPKECTDDGDVITCDAYDLAPVDGSNEHIFYYTAQVKAGVTGTIPNTAEIRPDVDEDTNPDNDNSDAVLTVEVGPENGVCGDGATTYGADVTSYPSGTVFCAGGVAVPSSPAFPAAGQTVTWTCQGVNGGTNTQCSATKAVEDEYDLTIDKYVGTSTADADLMKKEITSAVGNSVTYRLDYENLSSSTATPVGTKIYDDYDESKLDIIWTASNCTDTGTMLVCDAYDLAPGQTHTIYYVATIKSGATGPIPNTAEIVPDSDSNRGNNSGTVTSCTDAGEMNTNPNDEDINDCNDTSSANIILTAAPENGVCGDGATTYGSDVTSYPSGTVFCAGGVAVPSSPAFPAAGQTVTWTCQGVNGGTNTQCSATKAVEDEYDLTIDKYVGTSTADADLMKKEITSAVGNSVTYRLDYENLSSSTATPVGTKIYDDYDESKLDIIWTASNCTDTGTMLVCDAYDLAPGQTHTIYYVATIKSGATGPIPNTAEIVPDSDSNRGNNSGTVTSCTDAGEMNTNPNDEDINDCNDTSSANIILTAAPENVDVTIDKSVTPTQTVAGETVTYTLNYRNLTSGTTAEDVYLEDFPPNEHIDMSSLSFTVPSGVSCFITQDADPLVYMLQGQFIKCTVGNLAYTDGVQTITYTAMVKDSVAAGTNIDNVAKIHTSSTETNTTNNNDDARVTVIEGATAYDLTIDKLVDGVKNKTVSAGDTVTYTLTYENLTAGTTATNITIKDTFDNIHIDPLTVAFQNPLPTGVTCSLTRDDDPIIYLLNGDYIECTFDSLSDTDGAQTITYTAVVKDSVASGTTVTNTAVITPNPDDDTNPNNDSSSATVAVNTPVTDYDLSIDKKVDGLDEKTVAAGSTVTFTLDYANLDSSSETATNISIVDTYDASKLVLVTPLPAGCTDTSGTLTCTISSLAVGQSGTITYQARLLTGFTSGETINTVVITPNPDDDTNPNNDQSSAKVLVSTTTPVNGTCGTAGKAYSTSTTSYAAGSTFCATGTAVPATPAFPAINQTVTWTCAGSNGGSSVTCSATRPSGGGGGSSTPIPTATPTPASTPVSGGDGGGSNGGGGGCNTYSTIDLNIAKYIQVDNGSFVSAGSREAAAQLSKSSLNDVVYKVVVSNAGDASAYNVIVNDSFASSDGLTQSSVETLSGATLTAGNFEFIQPIPANGSREFTYSAKITTGASGVGTNTAKIEDFKTSYTCPKIRSALGVGRTSVAYVKAGTVASAGYVLDKTVDKRVVNAGEEVNYTLSIKNTGNVDMKNVILVDKFPSEFLEPIERLKPKMTNNRTLEFKRNFLPVGDTFSVNVTMIVRDGVPKGTEITNTLSGRSDTIDINDMDEESVLVGEGGEIAQPTCPAGYTWQADINTCKKNYIPRTPQSGLELPLLPLGLAFIGLAMIMRREDLAKMIG